MALGWQMGQWGEEGWGWGGFLSAIVCDIAVPMVCHHGSRAIKVPVVCHRAVPPCSLCHGGRHGVPLQSPWCGTVVPTPSWSLRHRGPYGGGTHTHHSLSPLCTTPVLPTQQLALLGDTHGMGTNVGPGWQPQPPPSAQAESTRLCSAGADIPVGFLWGGVGGLGTRTLSCAPLCPLGALLAAGGAATNAFGKQ